MEVIDLGNEFVKNKKRLKINRKYIRSMAEKRFKNLVREESNDTARVFKEIAYSINPVCDYMVLDDVEKISDGLRIYFDENKKGKIELEGKVFNSFSQEIIAGIIVYAMSIGRMPTTGKGIFYQGVADLVGTAYMDAMRNYLKETLDEDYIVGASISPGNGMKLEDISKIDRIINFNDMNISINESYLMLPEKSACGVYMIFKQEHPISFNSCETCMARGYGCNLCHVGGENA